MNPEFPNLWPIHHKIDPTTAMIIIIPVYSGKDSIIAIQENLLKIFNITKTFSYLTSGITSDANICICSRNSSKSLHATL